MKFAQIIDGWVINLCSGENKKAALAVTFAQGWVEREVQQGRDWVEVPDHVLPGAKFENGAFTNPPPQTQEFPTLSGSRFIAVCAGAIGFDRLDQLLAKSATVSALIQKAERVDRHTGNTPAALAYLMAGDNALTPEELELIEAAWRGA